MNEDKDLKEFSLIEEKFKDMPLEEPGGNVLMRVRDEAERLASRRPWWERIITVTTWAQRPAFSLALVLAVVVGLSYAVRQWRQTLPVGPNGDSGVASSSSNKGGNGEDFVASYTKSPLRESSPSLEFSAPESETFKDYIEGLRLFHEGKFKPATRLFEKVMASEPKFGKREQLYTYWVEALEKLGDVEAAGLKRQELKQIQQELEKQVK